VRRLVRTSEAASTELAEAVRWYEAQRPGLGAELLDAVTHTLEFIEQHPESGSPVPDVARGWLRRMLVQRFPYQIVYEVRATEIVVVAVAHSKRRPGYWKSRL